MKGEQISNFNVTGYGTKTNAIFPIIEDTNQDGNYEIWLGSHSAPGMEIKAYDIDGNVLHKFSKSGSYDSRSWPVAFTENGKMLVAYSALYGRYPRGIAAWDIAGNFEEWFYPMGPQPTVQEIGRAHV